MPTDTPDVPTATPDKVSAFMSYGISGLERYGGISRVYSEFLRDLQGPAGMKNFNEMRSNSAIAGAILFSAEYLMRRVTVKVKPKDSSLEAKKAAHLVETAIFEDLDLTWPDQLSEILTMLPFGFSLLEMRLKRRLGQEPPSYEEGLEVNLSPPPDYNYAAYSGQAGVGYKTPDWAPSKFSDGLIGFRSWDLRAQETMYMWEFDDDSRAIVMQQMAPPDYRIRRIPIAKCLHFRTRVNKANPEGVSILRNGWMDYYYSKNIQVFEGIGIERDLAGYPAIQIMKPDMANGLNVPDIWNPKNPDAAAMLTQLQKMVRGVRRDEQEGLVMPWWAEFKLLSTGSRRSFDTNSIVSRHDQRIAMSVMADFIMLGHESQGSKALATTKVNLFTSSLSSFMDTICALISRKAAPMLLRANGMNPEMSPSLEHMDVESVNIADLGEFIGRMGGVAPQLFNDPAIQRAMLEVAHFPTTGVGTPLTAPIPPQIPGAKPAPAADEGSDSSESGSAPMRMPAGVDNLGG